MKKNQNRSTWLITVAVVLGLGSLLLCFQLVATASVDPATKPNQTTQPSVVPTPPRLVDQNPAQPRLEGPFTPPANLASAQTGGGVIVANTPVATGADKPPAPPNSQPPLKTPTR